MGRARLTKVGRSHPSVYPLMTSFLEVHVVVRLLVSSEPLQLEFLGEDRLEVTPSVRYGSALLRSYSGKSASDQPRQMSVGTVLLVGESPPRTPAKKLMTPIHIDDKWEGSVSKYCRAQQAAVEN